MPAPHETRNEHLEERDHEAPFFHLPSPANAETIFKENNTTHYDEAAK